MREQSKNNYKLLDSSLFFCNFFHLSSVKPFCIPEKISEQLAKEHPSLAYSQKETTSNWNRKSKPQH
ncbi:hypothetical protein EUGRSUZ_F03044 [Eucalyptus grandis]|uniref:Uncharacterized protein n=2 Tax=Eucalyptus grandis TaxID=71139 RepID=A0ACC3KM56_EUCGR|nr:hypothetical protein EUGRSUZ_F03044 [Eucalyptus grandis]